MHVDDGPNQDPSKRTWDLYDDDGRPITTFEQLRASVLDTSDEAVKRLLTLPVAAAMPQPLKSQLQGALADSGAA
ncbi:MAG: hypothetical protein JO352_32575 [Chloroflexi bacterium]|nr:hypothetical protein [Chloroflexota bacterium]